MRYTNMLLKILKDLWLAWIAMVGAVATTVGLWQAMGLHAVILALGLLVVILLITLALKSLGTAEVKVVKDESEVNRAVTKLLRNARESLYYYGGVGLIGAHEAWRKQLATKLEDKNFTIVRMVDLKNIDAMKAILGTAMEGDELASEMAQYTAWLKTHHSNLGKPIKENRFYDFEGAPIWKYGVHFIVFDEKDVVFLCLPKEQRGAIFVHGRPDVARALTRSIDRLAHAFKPEQSSAKKLKDIVNGANGKP